MSADPSAANFNHQEGLWLLDFNYSWQITAALGINASVRNLFAEEPPITTGGNGALFNRNEGPTVFSLRILSRTESEAGVGKSTRRGCFYPRC